MTKNARQKILQVVKILTFGFLLTLLIETSILNLRSILFLKGDYLKSNSSHTLSKNVTEKFKDNPLVPPPGYLVWSNHCRMPDVDPFTKDALKIFKKKSYTPCSKEKPLTKVVYDINLRAYTIHLDKSATLNLIGTNDSISCCYQEILRSGTGNKVDKDFKLESCVDFKDGDTIPPHVDSFIVNCQSVKKKKKVQQDAHFLVREKQEVRERLNLFQNKTLTKRPVSVIMWGIDSMSRFNLRRVMPETAAHLLNDSWFELSGYNKVDDNTYPNLMAVLSGYNNTSAYSKCKPKNVGGLDDCGIIWDLFRKNGYVTAYSEDETWMSTFNFNKKGFKKNPVDYYQRPFLLAIERTLKKKKQSGMSFCEGLRHSAEYVYDFALELATRYKGEPYFGFFWTNTFTHNSFSDASSMDTRIAEYLTEMKERGILEDSIVILFSDHGMRFGPLRSLKQGFLEERLPFIFIWLPHWFRLKHPNFVEALKLNRYRLTNPFDLHNTLKHIIELSGRNEKLPISKDCPKCKSLFFPVPEHRSCKDAAIDEHWCTCSAFEDVKKTDKVILDGVSAILKHLNSYLEKGKFSPRCMLLKKKTVVEARQMHDFGVAHGTKSEVEHYRIRFTAQKGKFEASVTFSKKLRTYKIIDSVSRLDSYKADSECITDGDAKKYCICDKEYLIKQNKTKST